jgi:CPA2 family monovalent cation:H+ antiporter-2
MFDHGWTKDLLIVLATAGVIVPLFGRLRLGIVPGFLIAGVILGPGGVGQLAGDFPWLRYVTFSEPERVQPFAELGVLFLLFLIGLEFSIDRLWRMRRVVIGLGSAQVLLSAALIFAGAFWLSDNVKAAIVIGLALALSSTAVVTQVLIEKRRLASRVGRTAIGILLFQDLMVVPIVIVVGLLSGEEVEPAGAFMRGIVIAIVTLAGIVLAGRFLVRPLLRLAASANSRDLVVAIALLLVIVAAMLTSAVGLSPVLGAFLAGLLLSESEYRHQLDVDIEPFKGLLLGLFFMTVGMGLDVETLIAMPGVLAVGLAGVLAAKALALLVAARAFRLPGPVAAELALLMAGTGEFAFVVFTLALGGGILPADLNQIVVSVAVIAIILTPLLASLGEGAARQLSIRRATRDHDVGDETAEMTDHVIIGGFGRVGQMVASILDAERIAYVAIDSDADHVAAERRAGRTVYFGDATRPEMLERIGGARATAFVVTPNSSRAAARMVEQIRKTWPGAAIHARARDADDARQLAAAGADDAVPEALEASLQLAARVLDTVGLPEEAIDERLAAVRAAEMKRMGEAAPPGVS